MSLDQNLFTLSITPNKDDVNVVDLVDSKGVAHYRKQRIPGLVYKMEMYDPMSESLLISATSPSATSKHKTLELCNPTIIVELKHVGTLTFKWGFKWEEHEFEWKREECYMIRKPDPPVLVAVTKVSPGRLKTSSVQILDYNLNRFDIDDRKGLEIVLLTALLTFQDSNEAYHNPRDDSAPSSTAITPAGGMSRQASDTAPPPPPRPAPKTGIDRIAEIQRARGEYNEITVEDEGSVDDYAQYCSNLLLDDAMLFITLYSAAADQVPKVLQVVEQTKRIRHKAGLSDDQELHQYVRYDTPTSSAGHKGPRRINLDDDDKNKYAPPKSLSIHLSKIPMPELQPKTNSNETKKTDERSKKEKTEEKKVPPPRWPEDNKPRLSVTPPTSRARAHSHQTHSSLSQPNSPAAPPSRSRPVSSHGRPSQAPGVGASAYGASATPQHGPNLTPGGNTWRPPQQQPAVATPPAPPAQSAAAKQPTMAVVTGIFDRFHRRAS